MQQNKSEYEMVKDFHIAFNYPVSENHQPMSKDMVLNRAGFTAEEIIELLHTVCKDHSEFENLYMELLDRMDKSFVKQSEKDIPDDVLVAQVDALIDIKYFNNGDFTIVGVDPDEPFKIVHNANMTKLFPDGKPRYNEHGKIIKPDEWIPPENMLEQEIKRQKLEVNV